MVRQHRSVVGGDDGVLVWVRGPKLLETLGRSVRGRVGFDYEQLTESGTVRVVLEKDFARLGRPVGDA